MIAVDGVPAPRVFSTGPGLFSQMTFASPDEARRVIEPYRDGFGTHLLKWYMAGSRGERQALIEATARTRDDADHRGRSRHEGEPHVRRMDGFSGVEHAYPVAPIHDDLVQLVARTGITYTPTLVVAFGGRSPGLPTAGGGETARERQAEPLVRGRGVVREELPRGCCGSLPRTTTTARSGRGPMRFSEQAGAWHWVGTAKSRGSPITGRWSCSPVRA